MAENETHQDDKTEEPTQRRLDQARERGQVATSREINHWFIILGATIIVALMAPHVMGRLAHAMLPFIEHPHLIRLDSAAFRDHFGATMGAVALAMAGPIVLLIVFALAAPLVQNGFLFSAESIKPKLEKISPLKGLKRLFSLRSIAEFVKGILKLAIVGAVVAVLLLPVLDDLDTIAGLEIVALLDRLQALAARVLAGVLAVMTLIALADFLYQKFEHRKQLRMSRQDMKDEFKESDGDPIVRQRLRQIRSDRQRQRMMTAVPEADVVVTNPTHFAVALKYDQEAMQAPVVVAKGVDGLAHRIRAVAEEHGVPVVENPPLARALHAGVEIGHAIPTEHYRAVADIISYVWKLRGRSRG